MMDIANYITSTTFSITKNEDLVKLSSVDITSQLSSSNFKRNILSHPNFGPDPWGNQVCVICKEKYKNCNGHFGTFDHIIMYKTLYVPLIVKILNKVCFTCKKVFVKKSGKKIIEDISFDKKNINCGLCGSQKIKFVIYKSTKIYKSNKIDPIEIAKVVNGIKTIVAKHLIFNVLTNISFDTFKELGLKNIVGADLMTTVFPILSKKYRKDNKVGDRIMKNHIESLYQQLARSISDKNKNQNNHDKYLKHQSNIQTIEMQLIDGEKYRRSDGSPNNTILPKLIKKDGMIINDLICTRINNCIRAIIIAGSEILSINEIGIPKTYAKELIIYEYVTINNVHNLNSMLNNKDYPRIKFREEIINGEMVERSIIGIDKLKIGDLIARDLIHGDAVIANRHPTLSKNSMLCFKAHIISGKALALNIATCNGFGADFDGDQMNIYALKYPKIRNECFLKMCTSENIFSGAFSGVLVTPIQDVVAGLRILTTNYFYVNELYKDFILSNIETTRKIKENYIQDGIKIYYGKDILSLIIPENLNAIVKDDTGKVRAQIENGFLIFGELDKYTIMKQQKGLINIINEIYDEREATRFIDNLQLLGANFLKIYGMTTGLHDFYFNDEQTQQIQTMKALKFKTIYKDLSKYDEINPVIDKLITTEIERAQNNNDVLTKIFANEFHHFHDIITCGAKGKIADVNQMGYTVGQIFLGSERIKDRSLYIAKFDNSSKYGLGIIESSYIDGLNLAEIQMGNQNAVNSQAATQLSTAKPGYINKKINETVRDYIFMTDFTIRNPNGDILLQHYFNSFDTDKENSYVINMKIENHLFEDTKLANDIYGLNEQKRIKYNSYIQRVYSYMNSAKNKLNKYEILTDIIVFLPFDFETHFQNIKDNEKPFTNMSTIIDKIDHVLSNYNTSLYRENDNINKIPMCYALHYYFHPLIFKMSETKMNILFDIILNKIIYSQVEPGTSVLIKSGTSYNSVVTQEILSSIHSIKGGNVQKTLDDNFNVTKTVKDETIHTYIEQNANSTSIYKRLIFSDLISEITCEYKHESNKRIYKLLYSEANIPEVGLYFTFKFDIKKMIQNNLLLPFIFTNIIANVDKLIIESSDLSKQITYLHLSSAGIMEYPSISILIDGSITNVRVFINMFINIIKNINIRESNIQEIYVVERDFKYKKCSIEGITLTEALQLDFVKNDHIITSNLYSIYEKYGMFSYLTASLINLFNIGKDKKVNPKHGASISSVICYNNILISLNRQGFDKIAIGKWSNIAFESQSSNLVKAAVNNSIDYGQSINSQVIYGHKPKIGTNHAIISFDVSKIKNYSDYKIAEPKENHLFNIIKKNFNN